MSADLRLPRGDLLRSRVVDDPAAPLRTALERELTGYVVFEPSDALLLDGTSRGVLTLADGVPVLAYEARSDRGGPDAVAEFAHPGPYRVELYELPPAALAELHDRDAPDLSVLPATPATDLADAPALAEETRAAAPADRTDAADESSAVAAFLDDEERIDAIREQARDEARQRAAEWGLTGELGADGAETDADPGDAGGRHEDPAALEGADADPVGRRKG